MKIVNRIAVVAGVTVLASLATAQAGTWPMLGERLVDYRSNPVVISLKGDAPVKTLKLQVKDEGMDIQKLAVTTADGQTQDVEINTYMAPGRESSEIAINGGPKVVTKVEVVYRGGADGRRLARLRVLGTN